MDKNIAYNIIYLNESQTNFIQETEEHNQDYVFKNNIIRFTKKKTLQDKAWKHLSYLSLCKQNLRSLIKIT